MLQKLVIAGCIEAILLTAAALLKPEFLRDNAVWVILAATTILLLVALYESIKRRPATDSGGPSHTTHGAQSPIFRDVHGDVHIGGTPPATQERKTGHVGIDTRRGARRPLQEYPLAGRVQAYPLSRHQGPKPDMELREVCDRLYNSLSGPPELIADFERRVDRKIRDGVRHWRLHTWGRKNDPNSALVGVWGDAWDQGKFNHAKGWLRFKHPDNPNHVHEWTDLHFNRAEVDEWLPPDIDLGA